MPYEYEVYATYETMDKLEDKKLHALIDRLNPDLRVSKNREFFLMKPEEAYELLESIAIISGTADKLNKIKVIEEPTQRIKKPPVDFIKCGIPIGSKLVFIDNETVIATVYDNRKVEYNNEITSLSAITSSIKGYRCAGPSFFTYNGNLVADIANETQWKDFN